MKNWNRDKPDRPGFYWMRKPDAPPVDSCLVRVRLTTVTGFEDEGVSVEATIAHEDDWFDVYDGNNIFTPVGENGVLWSPRVAPPEDDPT